MSIDELRILFRALWEADPYCKSNYVDLDVTWAGSGDSVEVRLFDQYANPPRVSVCGISGQLIRYHRGNTAALYLACEHEFHQAVLRLQGKEPVPVVRSAVCPCGIHRADCDYHR